MKTKVNTQRLLAVISIIIPVLSLLYTAIVYGSLPDTVESKWDLCAMPQGRPVGKSIVFITGTCVLLYMLYMVISPYIDPKKGNYAKFRNNYYTLTLLLSVALSGVNGMFVLVCYYTYRVELVIAAKVLISVAMLLCGNYLPQVRDNSFLGVVNPWTVASHPVWYRTHRFTGRLLVILGITCLCLSFVNVLVINTLFICLLAASFITPHAYSIRLFYTLPPSTEE